MLLAWALTHAAEVALLGGSCMLAAIALSSLLDAVLKNDGASKKHDFLLVILSPLVLLKSRLKALSFLIQGPAIIQAAYEKVFTPF